MRYLDSNMEYTEPIIIDSCLSLDTLDDVLYAAEVAHSDPQQVIDELLGKETSNVFVGSYISDTCTDLTYRLVGVMQDDLVTGGKAALSFISSKFLWRSCDASMLFSYHSPSSIYGEWSTSSDPLATVTSIYHRYISILLDSILTNNEAAYSPDWKGLSDPNTYAKVTKTYDIQLGQTYTTCLGNFWIPSYTELGLDIDSSNSTVERSGINDSGIVYKYYNDADPSKRIFMTRHPVYDEFSPRSYYTRTADFSTDGWIRVTEDGHPDVVPYSEDNNEVSICFGFCIA